eukprot:s386_g50.t1
MSELGCADRCGRRGCKGVGGNGRGEGAAGDECCGWRGCKGGRSSLRAGSVGARERVEMGEEKEPQPGRKGVPLGEMAGEKEDERAWMRGWRTVWAHGTRGSVEIGEEKEPLGMSLDARTAADGAGASLDARTAADGVGAREWAETGREKETLGMSELGCADGCGRRMCKGGLSAYGYIESLRALSAYGHPEPTGSAPTGAKSLRAQRLRAPRAYGLSAYGRQGPTGSALTGAKSLRVHGPWALFKQKPLAMRLHHFKRHEMSKAHILACEVQGAANVAILAPPKEIFQDALKKMRSGGSARDGGIASDKKQQIRWTLAEASMEIGREVLQHARCIAITRDERKGKLLVRWRACRDDLSSASGVFGFGSAEGFADSLADRVKEMIQDYCRPRLGMPRGFSNAASTTDLQKQVEQNIRNKTKVLVTDGAAPELLASALVSGRRPFARSSAREEYLHGVKVIGRDAPHATTRLLKRPFNASQELSKLMEEYISGKDSFCQKVFHSPLYTTWWQEMVKEDRGGPTSIAAAKHHFASFSLPLGQVTDNLESVLKLCSKISLIRGSAGEWATKILQTFSGKKAVLLAMACDAAATCSELTRTLDNEEADVAQLNERCGHFALSVQALFVSEKIWTLPTYTKALVSSLERNPVCLLNQGCAKEVRVTAEDKRFASKVMQDSMAM